MTRDLDGDNLKDAALGVYVHVAQLMKAGKTAAEIEQTLEANGIKPETTRMMMQRLIQSQVKVSRRNGRWNLALGFVLVGLGMLFVTGGASGNPVEGAGSIFAWMSILIGIFWIVRGGLQMRGAARLERPN
jgi:hypothetical protein